VHIRSLGGPLALKWLSHHAAGHPNTTVQWSNGTHVQPHEVPAIFELTKRWGWSDPIIDAAIWGGSYLKLTLPTVAGAVGVGFAAAIVWELLQAGTSWLRAGKSQGSVVEHNNDIVSRRSLQRRQQRNGFEQNVYYHQSVSNQPSTGQWPSSLDVQNGIHSSLQDMADHDYQAACYNLLQCMSCDGPGEGCEFIAYSQFAFCSWMDGQSCTTPGCGMSMGEESCPIVREADGQFGK